MIYILKRFGSMLLIFLLAGLILYPACQYPQHESLANRQSVQPLEHWTWQRTASETNSIQLPYTFKDLPARTPIILTTTVAGPGDYMLIKSIYAPFRLYIDNVLAYSSEDLDSYPGFFLDPPTQLQLIPLPDTSSSLKLRLEYLSPIQRTELRIPVIETGGKADLRLPIFQQSGIAFILSLLLLFLSLLPIAAALFLLRKKDISQAFLQLGLFGLCVGVWSFSECDLTVLFLPYPSLLYLLAFLGLFTFSIPLLKFGLCILRLPKSQLLRFQIHFTEFAVFIAICLQLTGTVGFAQNVYFFRIFLPLSLSLFAFQLCRAAWKQKNDIARRFAVPITILACAAVLELLNYQLRFTNNISFFFLLGSLLFILSLGILTIRFIQSSLRLHEEKKRLEFELRLAERQTDVQRTQYAILTEHEQILREQRHDLRHQLIVLKSYSQQRDNATLENYIDELTAKIPLEKDLFFCSNFVVNSLALYFQSLAKHKGIHLELQLTAIAEKNGSIQDSDLCIILGNLLENAMEACAYLPPEQRWIQLQSRIYAQKLILIMKNSYDGFYSCKDGMFYSRKRPEKGTGLASVESVAHKYHGLVDFQPEDNCFVSAVYLLLV